MMINSNKATAVKKLMNTKCSRKIMDIMKDTVMTIGLGTIVGTTTINISTRITIHQHGEVVGVSLGAVEEEILGAEVVDAVMLLVMLQRRGRRMETTIVRAVQEIQMRQPSQLQKLVHHLLLLPSSPPNYLTVEVEEEEAEVFVVAVVEAEEEVEVMLLRK
jgi:hypothetical protein